MELKGKLALALALVPISFGAARAATISYFDSFGSVAVPFPAAALATLPLFDPALGTLTQVTLTLDAVTHAGTISFDNEAAIPTDITLGIGAEVTAVGLAGVTAVAVPLQLGSGSIDADNDGAADFIGTDSFSVTGGSGSDSDSDVLTAGLGPYIGVGTFDVDVSAVVETFLSTTGGYGPIDPVPGTTAGTVTVTYEFTPAPEPSTALLVGAGLLGLASLRRRCGPA